MIATIIIVAISVIATLATVVFVSMARDRGCQEFEDCPYCHTTLCPYHPTNQPPNNPSTDCT